MKTLLSLAAVWMIMLLPPEIRLARLPEFRLRLPFAEDFQSTASVSKNDLVRRWKYEKRQILGIPYPAESHEKSDFLDLRPNQTFIWRDGGREQAGTWEFLQDSNLLLLKAGNEIRNLVVESLEKGKLRLKLREPWKFEITLHMQMLEL